MYLLRELTVTWTNTPSFQLAITSAYSFNISEKLENRGGRTHKLKDPKPLRIQQKEIRIRSWSAIFPILRSGSASKQLQQKGTKVDLR